MAYVIGIDTGGTFTDTVVVDEGGARTVAKSSTTPDAPEEGVLNSLEKAAEELDQSVESLLSQTETFYHGTTLVTNALVEMEGSDIGYITTQGFTDEIHIGQVKSRTEGLTRARIQHYASLDKPEPIVEKQFIKGVPERIDSRGEVIVPIDEAATRQVIRDLLEKGVDGIAVNLLWSHANQTHEERVKELVADEAEPDVFVSASHEIVRRLGEYSRGATTLVNTFTGPLMQAYASALEEDLRELELEAPIYLMQSNGGVMPIDEMTDLAVKALGSGPVAGVTGSGYLGQQLDSENIIATDVGGTSFDVGLVIDGEPKTIPEQIVNQYTLYQTAVDIESIGSGAGSIAWVDDADQLHVGPESAGADPGPACYDQGGDRPTVMDADLLLGYLDDEYFVGGDRELNRDKAREAIREHVAEPMGISVEEAAAGIFRIVNFHMADLLRKVTIERGYDPRRFDLYAYGGAGPMHASFYGEEIDAQSVTIPLSSTASVYSAFGISTTDVTRVEESSHTTTEPFDTDEIADTFSSLEQRAVDRLSEKQEGRPEDISFKYTVDMRYKNQVNELEVPIPRDSLSAESVTDLGERFEEVYEQRYGEASTYAPAPVEIATFRVTATVDTPDPTIKSFDDTGDIADAYWQEREVYWESAGEYLPTDIYDGEKLANTMEIDGPAIVQAPETTITVRPHQHATIDEYQNIIIGGSE
jgi:N-methylhydantoinase A